jgi:hypothetical protein
MIIAHLNILLNNRIKLCSNLHLTDVIVHFFHAVIFVYIKYHFYQMHTIFLFRIRFIKNKIQCEHY